MARSRQIPALAPWRPSLSEASGPIYLAIADALAADVQAGRLAAGRQLPTQRSLAAALSVDLTTITRAYNEAQARGLIEARVGQGTFVKALSELPTRRPDLSMNLPPMFDDPPLAARLWREVAQVESLGGLPLLLSYQDASGAAVDKLAATRWLRPRMPDLAAERVVIAAGAQAAMLAIFTLICQRGDVVCAEALSFPRFRSLASLLGLQVIAVEMDRDGLLPDAFEAVCRRAAPKALYCTPTLHNPTTATLPADRRAALAGIARRYGVHIVEDDAYGPLQPDALAPHWPQQAPELTYYIGGLAKVMSPALRVAHVVAPSARDAQRLGAIRRDHRHGLAADGDGGDALDRDRGRLGATRGDPVGNPGPICVGATLSAAGLLCRGPRRVSPLASVAARLVSRPLCRAITRQRYRGRTKRLVLRGRRAA